MVEGDHVLGVAAVVGGHGELELMAAQGNSEVGHAVSEYIEDRLCRWVALVGQLLELSGGVLWGAVEGLRALLHSFLNRFRGLDSFDRGYEH